MMMNLKYDDPAFQHALSDAIGMRVNMTYDTGPNADEPVIISLDTTDKVSQPGNRNPTGIALPHAIG